MPYTPYNPYQIQPGDSSLNVPNRLTFPAGTWVTPSGGASTAAFGSLGTAAGYNPAMYRGGNVPVVQPFMGFRTPQNMTGVSSPAMYRGRGGLGANLNMQTGAFDTSQITAVSDLTGTVTPGTLAYMSQITGIPTSQYLGAMAQSGWQFDPTTGNYVSQVTQSQSQGQSQSESQSEYRYKIGRDYYRYDSGAHAYQAQPGERGNRSGHSFRNAHGTLVNYHGKHIGSGKGGGENKGGRWNSSVSNQFVNFLGATG